MTKPKNECLELKFKDWTQQYGVRRRQNGRAELRLSADYFY